MNYNRRPNRPDAGVYRQMRRQSLGSSRGGLGFRRGRGGGRSRGVWLAIFVAVIVSVIAWRLMH